MSATDRAAHRMDQLERAVVFRTARGSFFLMAVIAALTFIGGLVVGTLGYIKLPIARPAEPPPIPDVDPPPPITYEQVETWIAAEEARRKAARSAPAPRPPVYRDADEQAPAARQRDPLEDQLARLDGELRGLFPAPTYAWDDDYESHCVNDTPYGCLREETRVTKPGLSRAVKDVLKGRSREEKATTLTLLVAVLQQAPVERRGALLGPIITVNDEALRDYRQRREEREWKVEEQSEAFAADVRRYEGKLARRAEAKAEQRRYGRYGIVVGLGLLILVSVFLVHFAMERHLRLMRDLLDLHRRAEPLAVAAGPASPAGPAHRPKIFVDPDPEAGSPGPERPL